MIFFFVYGFFINVVGPESWRRISHKFALLLFEYAMAGQAIADEREQKAEFCLPGTDFLCYVPKIDFSCIKLAKRIKFSVTNL